MTLADTTATLQGVTIGAGTSYRWAEWPAGILSTGQVRKNDVPKAQANGVLAGSDWRGSKQIVFDVHILGSSKASAEQLASDLAAAFAPSDTDQQLLVRLSGTPDEYLMFGRPDGLEIVIDRKFLGGTLRARCEFRATDPIRYSTTLQSATTGLSTSTGGLTFPFTFPFTFGTAGTGSTMSCPNNGTQPTWWTATFTGPLVAPALTHVGTGKQILLPGLTLAAGETLVITSKPGARSALLNGTANRYGLIASASQWFDLAPGANAVALGGASGSGTVTVTWRSAWK